MEEIVGQLKWTTITNHTQGQSSTKEGDVVHMVELEESLLWPPSWKPNNSFQQVLLPIRLAESNTRQKSIQN